MSGIEVEGRWTTKAGLLATVVVVRGAHRCGYVRVPYLNPLFGVGYGQHSNRLRRARRAAMGKPLGKRSVMTLFSSGARDGTATPEIVFDVHGGITYSGDLQEVGAWWYGFDAAHAGDGFIPGSELARFAPIPGDVVRDYEYMAAECESLAAQIVEATRPWWRYILGHLCSKLGRKIRLQEPRI